MRKINLLSIVLLLICSSLTANNFENNKVLQGEYKIVTKKVLVKPAVIKRLYIPPVYQTVQEKILVAPYSIRWVKGRRNGNCLVAPRSPDDCRVWVLKETSPTYKIITKQFIIKAANFKDTLISAAVYKMMPIAIPITKSHVVAKEKNTDFYKLAEKPIQVVSSIRQFSIKQRPTFSLEKVKLKTLPTLTKKRKVVKVNLPKQPKPKAKTIKQTTTYTDFALKNSPNPFSQRTDISYTLPQNDFVSLRVYNVLGKLVKTLVNEPQRAGKHRITFERNGLTGGMYFYTLEVGDKRKSRAMVIVK